MTEIHRALSREAALASAHIGEGVTALGNANYAQPAYYYQAFFALSLGFERSAKLGLLVDHAVQNGGAFPTNEAIRAYGHGVEDLLLKVDGIGQKYRSSDRKSDPLPSTEIHSGIIKVLDHFARNLTRYYNIDFVTASRRIEGVDDPVLAWNREVVEPVAAQHYSDKQAEKHRATGEMIAALMGNNVSVRFSAEDGSAILNAAEASFRTGKAEAVAPWVRMYVLQIARFLSHLMSDLSFAAYGAGTAAVPHLSDFYGFYNNPDRYFRQKKVWSLYKR